MDTATKPSLASRIGALAETGTDFRSAPDEARTTLHSLRQEYPELRKFLEHRFASLPEAQRQAVELLYLEQLSVADAAARAGVSASALKVRAHRGSRALRRALRAKDPS